MALNHGTTTPIECREVPVPALTFFVSHTIDRFVSPLQFSHPPDRVIFGPITGVRDQICPTEGGCTSDTFNRDSTLKNGRFSSFSSHFDQFVVNFV